VELLICLSERLYDLLTLLLELNLQLLLLLVDKRSGNGERIDDGSDKSMDEDLVHEADDAYD
jgi:hypothetical protein